MSEEGRVRQPGQTLSTKEKALKTRITRVGGNRSILVTSKANFCECNTHARVPVKLMKLRTVSRRRFSTVLTSDFLTFKRVASTYTSWSPRYTWLIAISVLTQLKLPRFSSHTRTYKNSFNIVSSRSSLLIRNHCRYSWEKLKKVLPMLTTPARTPGQVRRYLMSGRI